ncbi:MAG TPA: MBL fold metallo-hydrolase [Acidimicrobiales bacterium]|nr:MBL fold metallo-hydrolase [Acidimicrobiales bacterium]
MLELLHVAAHEVTTDTFLIPTIAPEPSGAFVSAHTLVIRGAEPVVVDTGCSLAREQWLANLSAVVDLDDVRWIFLSHDDHDHIGNLDVLLEQCPQATLVGNWSIVSRLGGDIPLPLERMRWLDPGDAFDVGDRTLHLVRPPLFDSPATRGLFDARSGVLWAVDTFGALVQGPVLEADDADPELFDATFDAMNAWNTPWLEWVDTARFGEHVRRTASLPVTAVASAHGPVLRGLRILDAFERTAALAARPALPTPGQAMLDEVLATLGQPAPSAA